MKRNHILCILLTLLLLLCACGGNDPAGQNAGTSASNSGAESAQASAASDPAGAEPGSAETASAETASAAPTSAGSMPAEATPAEALPAGTTLSASQPDIRAVYADTFAAAEHLRLQYDYEGACELLQTIPGADAEPAVQDVLEAIRTEQEACTAVDPAQVPHIFFHSLIADPERCFDTNTFSKTSVDGYNAWMVTIDEFKACLEQLYEAGWVYVMLSDLYTLNDGVYTPNTDIRLPEGKKAIVMSFDDLAYYAQYMHRGFADKIVLDENGKLKCRYTDKDGNVFVGDYDYLPIFDEFLELHPDAAWHGAKATIALTGYDGVFGYRTDVGFFDNPTYEEQQWLNENPGLDINEEIRQAKIIAEAIKADGWEFASHSWGHRPMGSKGLDWLKTDTGKWLDRVAPIVGDTDILIYPHGSDIAGREDYTSSNEKYAFLKSQGFGVFANVDASGLYWYQYRDDYVRTARIDIDGWTLYQALGNDSTVISALGLDAASIFDPVRPTPVIANGAE